MSQHSLPSAPVPTVPRPFRRSLAGGALGLTSLLIAVALLLPVRSSLDTGTVALILLLPGVAGALWASRPTALAISLAATVAFNVGFLRPYGELKVNLAEDVVALVAFGGVALLAANLVGREHSRRQAAEFRAAQIEALDRENTAIRQERERLAAEAMGLTLAGEHRSALLRSVSHDLRTPLATIRAVISDLREEVGYDRAAQEDLLDLVADEAERLDRLVANLLSMSRVDAGALIPERQSIPLDELIESCVHRHARLVRDRKIAFDVPMTLPLVDADWTLVDQVITNLLANAVRHAPEGSRIELAARRRGHQLVEVSVTDQGPGVPPELHESVFTPFRRGPGSSSSGVGLAIVRAIVEAHGGCVAIGDGPRGGARVAFTLPVHGA